MMANDGIDAENYYRKLQARLTKVNIETARKTCQNLSLTAKNKGVTMTFKDILPRAISKKHTREAAGITDETLAVLRLYGTPAEHRRATMTFRAPKPQSATDEKIYNAIIAILYGRQGLTRRDTADYQRGDA